MNPNIIASSASAGTTTTCLVLNALAACAYPRRVTFFVTASGAHVHTRNEYGNESVDAVEVGAARTLWTELKGKEYVETAPTIGSIRESNGFRAGYVAPGDIAEDAACGTCGGSGFDAARDYCEDCFGPE